MKSKTIKAVLQKKINEWTATIQDEDVRKLAEKNTIITGGAIASMLLKEEVKDYDVYFRNKETVMAVAQYYCDEFNKNNPNRTNSAFVLDCDNKEQLASEISVSSVKDGHLLNLAPGRVKVVIKSAGVAAADDAILEKPFEDVFDALDSADQIPATELDKGVPKYVPVFLSSNAITLSNKVQIVVRFYGSPDEIHENYDFVHCTNYYDAGSRELVLRAEALESLLAKELKYVGSKYPLCSIIRTRKFINRGYTVNAGQYLKMCMQLNELDLTDINVLEDQLVGVDSAYFNQLIRALRAASSKDENFSIDNTYVATIIDRIF